MFLLTDMIPPAELAVVAAHPEGVPPRAHEQVRRGRRRQGRDAHVRA